MQEETIVVLRDYGCVRLKLKKLMDSRGINRNALARSIGARFEVVDKWYQGNVEKLDLDILLSMTCARLLSLVDYL